MSCVLIFFRCLQYTFGVGLGGGVGWANNVLALAYLLYFYTTSSYVKISLSWCYVTRTSLDLMLRYVAVEISLSWCYVTRTSLDFMLRYVAFSCASYTTSSYVKISLPTCKVGKETQPWLKSTWSKVNNLRNIVFLVQESIFFHVSTQWNCEIQSLKPCSLHMKWNMCTKGKSTKCCKGLRNVSWDALQNSQKQRDRHSVRDLKKT